MRDTRADLGHRLLFGFLHRQGVRRADALGGTVDAVEDAVEDEATFGDVPPLTWGRVDVRRGCILPDRNKSKDISLTPIEPDLVRALGAWKGLHPKAKDSDPVFVTLACAPIKPGEVTDAYRTMLRAALVAEECDRVELWTPGHGCLALRLHDARASFVTVALTNGRSEEWVPRSFARSSSIARSS